MKKLAFLLLASILVMTSFSCGGSGGGTDTSPAPKAADDSSYKGVYKGILSGSTGHFYIDAYNTDATKLTLAFTFDGVSKTIEGAETTSGSNYVYSFSDSGYVMTLEVTPTGSIVLATFTFTGHTGDISVDADKATSTTDVSVWEGTNTGTCGSCSEAGVWNLIVKGSTITGTHAGISTGTGCGNTLFVDGLTGTLTGESASFQGADDVTATGTISGTSMSGTWGNSHCSGTFSGTKTL